MSLELLSSISKLKIGQDLRETVRAIAEEANDFGCMNSSVDYLAWKVDCEPRTIQRHIVKLRQLGALVKVKDSGFHRPCTYRLNLDVFPFKPAFVPKGDTLDTRDRHDGIFVPASKGDISDIQARPEAAKLPPPKGDILSPEVLLSTSTSTPASTLCPGSFGTVRTVPVLDSAKTAESRMGGAFLADADPSRLAGLPPTEEISILEPVGGELSDDPFAGIGETPPIPEEPRLDGTERRLLIQSISVGEGRGNKLSGESWRAFDKDWLDEVAPIIQRMFGYASPTSECYTVARQLLKKKRPKIRDKLATYMEILNALDALASAPEARHYKNNPRVNPYLVPMWVERQLAQGGSTGKQESTVNGSFVI